MEAEGETEEAVQKRLARDGLVYPPERRMNPLYDHIIENDGSVEGLETAFLRIIAREKERLEPHSCLKGS